jgi:hypothetical protein
MKKSPWMIAIGCLAVMAVMCMGLFMTGCSGGSGGDPVLQKAQANLQDDATAVLDAAHPVVKVVLQAEAQKAAADVYKAVQPANTPAATTDAAKPVAPPSAPPTMPTGSTGIVTPSASGDSGSSTGAAVHSNLPNTNATMNSATAIDARGGTSSDASASGG